MVKTAQKQREEIQQKNYELKKVKNEREHFKRQNLVLQSAVDQALMQRDAVGRFWSQTLLAVVSVLVILFIALYIPFGYPYEQDELNVNMGDCDIKAGMNVEMNEIMKGIRENRKLIESIRKELKIDITDVKEDMKKEDDEIQIGRVCTNFCLTEKLSRMFK